MKLINALRQFGLYEAVSNGLISLTASEAKYRTIMEELGYWTFQVNQRAVGRAGVCRHLQKEVQVTGAFMVAGNEKFRDNTILHEVAHAVNRLIYGKGDKHGPNWRRIMRAFGAVPQRCCSREESLILREARKKKIRWIYACTTCEVEIPALRRKKYSPECYKHTGCGGRLYIKRDASGQTHPNPTKQERGTRLIRHSRYAW